MNSYEPYANRGSYRGGRSYASYARKRDSMGRYSRGYSMDGDEFRSEMESLMSSAPNEHIKQKMRELMRDM